MFRSIPVSTGVLATFVVSLSAIAAEKHPQSLDKIVVTATRFPVPIDDVVPSTFVIDRTELERTLAPDITDLLRFRTGLEIGRYGGPGQTTSLFLRGTDSNHTLVLLDGVRINPGTVGGAALQNISPQLIERIEVVKGPRSTLYGTDAIGGVIQIFTHAKQAEGFSTSASYGSDATMSGNATGGWQGESSHIGFGFNYLESDGFPPRIGDSRAGAYDDFSFNLAGSTDLGGGELGATFWRANGAVDYIGFSSRAFENAQLTQDYVNEAGVVHYEWLLGAWQSRVEVGRMVDEIEQREVRDSLGSFESTDYSNTHRTTIGWQNDFTLSDSQHLTAGVSFADEKARSEGFGEIDTDIVNAFVQDHFTLGKHDLTGAVGYVDHETTGGHTTWNVDYGFHLTPAWRLIASAGSAFRAPDATDRFGFGGNIDLKPEESRNYELGLRYSISDDQRLSLSAFHNDVDELITYLVTDPVTFDGQLENVDRARIRGIELGYRLDRATWQLRADAIYQDPEDRATGDQLLRRAKENFTLGYLQRLGRVEVGIDLLAAGKRFDFGGTELDSYVLTNLSARLNLGAGWSATAQIENVLDEEYELVSGYRTQDRAAYIGVRYEAGRR
jgi:vitamin B12 transporter